MNSYELQPPPLPIRLLLLILGSASVVSSILSLAGFPLGIFSIAPIVVAFLLLRMLGLLERARAKKRALGRSARPEV